MISLLKQNFNPTTALASFEKNCGDAGAVVSFLGRVRAENGVRELYLEAYPEVTETGIEAAKQRAESRWSLTACHIIHRIGTILAGDPIVLVMTAATHRRDAFQACDFLMDYLKTEAIFWKRETTDKGSEWIEPRAQDYKDSKRWKQNGN